MHKNDLVKAVAQEAGCLQKDADAIISIFVDKVKTALKGGDKVTLIGFGTFSVSETKEKMGRNPQTGKEIKIAASKRVKFKPGKALKEEVKTVCCGGKKCGCKKK